MEVKPGYKQTEVGVIPEDWELNSLDSIATVTSGKRLPLGRSLIDQETPHPYIRVTDMRPGTVSLTDIQFVPVDVFPAIKRFRIFQDDLFISVAGSLGIVGKIPPELDGANLTENADRITNISCSRDYLLHVLLSPLIQNTIKSLQTVGAQPKLALTRIRKFDIPLPPTLTEQRAIAEALSDADALIESLEQLIAKKRLIKQGAMQELLTGKRRLPGFEGEWVVKSFGEICSRLLNGGTPSTHREEFWTGKIPWISGADILDQSVGQIRRYITEDAVKKSATNVIEKGNLLVVTRTGVGKIAIAPFDIAISQDFTGVHLNEEVADTNFIFRYLDANSFLLRNLIQGTSISGITRETLTSIVLTLPPSLEEQSAIAAILSDMDAEIAALEVRLAKSRQLKQGMMQELLTGRIRLVSASPRILPLSKKDSPKHSWQFNEAVVIAVLASHFGSEQYPLGRKRYNKISYLLHHHAEKKAEGYLKKAAGPYNPGTKYGGSEAIAIKKGYIRQHTRDKLKGFIAGENINEAKEFFVKWYGNTALRWLEQFRFRTNDELELVTTVHMSIEDLKKSGSLIGVGQVKQVIQDHPEWKAKLERDLFSDANIARAINECTRLFQ